MTVVSASVFSPFPRVVFGMSTRLGGVSPEPYGMNLSFSVGDEESRVLENQQRFLTQLGVSNERLAIAKQVHGDRVLFADKPGEYERCDALFTTSTNLFLRISIADCLPIFLFDPESEAIAAIHAGWRGCEQNIVEKTVQKMKDDCSTDPLSLRAFIGPSARSCCYEIGEDVARRFDSRFLVRNRRGRFHLNMIDHTLCSLSNAGVNKSFVEVDPRCTICTPQLFHSYRRDGGKAGRMAGIIGLRPD